MRLHLPVQRVIKRQEDLYEHYIVHLRDIKKKPDKGSGDLPTVLIRIHGKFEGMSGHDPQDPSPWLCRTVWERARRSAASPARRGRRR
ncbi:hypothetical protein BGM19_38940 [Streptomyces agglomeratus]|uniref:hypothetical protein n=1 Tax=Streptomyces agglomeratus TaxID=285458 RepID=UPI00086CBDB9|nr:hypothetical protein [Streptomyces agglomeratus]OEJ56614.1 hypothetical protein BGM19_38940 [Streptomyces agglomeratus]